MPKSITLGNSTTLIGLDKFGQVKDYYFDYAGLENHVSEHLTHKIGVRVEESFTWLGDASWQVTVNCQKDTLASDISAKNDNLGIELHFSDVVYNEKDMFVREIKVSNLFDRKRDIKIFFNQQFNIGQTQAGETAYYDPRGKTIIHYKGRRVFLINVLKESAGFDEYSIGLLGIEGKDGTYKDAEDGILSGNPIEHGRVDSVIGVNLEISPKSEKTFYYWVCAAKSIKDVKALDQEILARHPKKIIESTINYWKAWVNVQNFSFYGLSSEIIALFQRSLFYIRTHVSTNGAIIASGDSEMLQFGRDYYEYVWPRDAAFAAMSLAKAGDFNASRRFFEFCHDVVTEEGYFMHKYRPDKSLGSSWHPWVQGGKKQFPIQEDETALVIYALWRYFELSKDLEFIEGLYNSLIKRCADFMVSFRDGKTGLPSASYDLWERVYGISTFTSSGVYAALVCAARFAKLLGKYESQERYESASYEIKKAILKYLYSEKEDLFYKLIDTSQDKPRVDKTQDLSSVFGIYKFEILSPGDPKLNRAFDKTIERLEVMTDIGGIARFEGDSYHFKGGNYPGNPWVVTTMWLAQYYIALAKKENDLQKAQPYISWALKIAGSAGTLPEQLDPYTGEHLSASPLVWSHAEFVTTIISYLEKLEELGVCEACYPIT